MLAETPDLSQRLLEDLRQRLDAPALQWREPPERLEGGFENLTAALRLEGAPSNLSGPLILRRFRPDRDPAGIRFESAVHSAVARQHYPAPRVLLHCEDPEPIDGAYLLMERLPGHILLGEVAHIDQVFTTLGSTLRHAPRMVSEALGRIPRDMARMHARLHGLDAKAVASAVECAGFSVDSFTARGRLDDLTRRATEASLDGLRPAIDWLHREYREPAERVVCHADFHFLNMLVDRKRVTGIIDWSFQHVCFDAPEFDVGNTRAVLDIDLPGLPPPVRRVLQAVQRRLLRRYTSLYERRRPLDRERVLWSEVYRYVRELVHAGESLPGGEPVTGTSLEDFPSPWLVPEVLAGTLAGIERRCGVAAALP